MSNLQETYISIDVETAGPNPSTYSLLSIGACSVFEPEKTFYIELQPVNENRTSEAMEIGGLNWEQLREKGSHPKDAMEKFTSWVREITKADSQPVFVAFNAPFDWMFLSDYFHRYLGQNPFGHKALDIKAFYMGLHGVPWGKTSMRFVSPRYLDNQNLTHHALQDALDQAEIFRKLLAEANNESVF
jgi:ribonuclease T